MISFGNFKYIIYIITPALIAFALFVFYIIWKRRMIRTLFSDEASGSMLIGSRRKTLVKNILTLIAIPLFAFVMLRPQWGELIRDVKNEGSDVLIMLDVSRSMLATDVNPNRLQRAKDAVKWIAGSLKGDRIGLIIFAGDAFLQCPLTNDIGAFMMFLDAASPDSVKLQGTDLGKAFAEAYRVFQKKRITSRILVLVTDGEDNEGASMKAIDMFKELDVSVYTLGVGRDSGEPIPEALGSGEDKYLKDSSGKVVLTKKDTGLLKKLAGATGGKYFDISDNLSGLKFILEIIDDQQRNEYGTRIIKERKEQYQIFAIVLILILSIEVMLTERNGFSYKRKE